MTTKLAQWAQKKSGWLKQRKRSVLITAVIIGLTFATRPLLWPDGFGFKEDKTASETIETVSKDLQGNPVKTVKTTKDEPGKTLWDWLSLLGVPLSLAILGYWLQQQQQRQATAMALEQQKRAEAEAKEETLQVYIDRISILLIDKNLLAIAAKIDKHSGKLAPEGNREEHRGGHALPSEKEMMDVAVDVIRARTLSILRRFEDDSERKTSVIQFLIETKTLSKLKLDLSEGNLSGTYLNVANLSSSYLNGTTLRGAYLIKANLSGAYLEDANLSGAHLDAANLSSAHLKDADLNKASLNGANLSGAYLRSAYLISAKLRGAYLISANLSSADLSSADLSIAYLISADLRGANLSNTNLSDADLSDANLKGAKLSGTDLDSIAFDAQTIWPEPEEVAKAKNIPDELKEQLGLT